METVFKDIRYGFRNLWKQPTFTGIAILTLALGIGANTAIFSVINAVLLRPLPYSESDQLVFLNERSPQMEDMSISYPNFTDWRAQNRVFEKIGVYNRSSYNLTSTGDAERILTCQASADLFAALRVQPATGRLFTNDEDKPGGNPVVILGYGLWQRRFGGEANILNQNLTLNGRSYTVIGVMPQGFQYPNRVDMWVPVGQLSGQESWQYRGNHPGLYGVARLRSGVTFEQARADMDNIAVSLERQYPDTNKSTRVRMMPLLEISVRDIRRALWILFGAVLFVLLIGCANIANLLLARAAARQREMAIRTALGAGRWRIVRQLLTESVMLALVGGGFGLLLAQWGIAFILTISPNSIPRAREINLDWRVLAFTVGASVVTGLIFGLVPAVQSSRADIQETLKETARGSSNRRHHVRNVLVIFEMATTLVLLIGAGLLIRSFYRLQQVNPGFSYDHLTSLSISLPEKKYVTPQQRVSFFQQLIEKIQGLPGVTSVGAASGLPLGNNGWQTSFTVEGRPIPPPDQYPLMEACVATADYFRAMSIPLLKGRYFDARDNRTHLEGRDLSKASEDEKFMAGVTTLIIDEEFARRYWPNEDPIGKRIRLGSKSKDPLLTVIGEVGRVRMEGLNEDSNRVQGYFPFLQMPFDGMTIVIKSVTEPTQLIATTRQQVKEVDPDQPIYDIRTMEDIRSESVAPERLNLTLLAIFAGVALVLAIVGIYGVMSYAVTQRTHEIGIRMALGARATDVLKLVVKNGMSLALVGVLVGLAGAFILTRLMARLLFGVTATDTTTFTVVSLGLIGVALLACIIPARRATKVDPLVALRYE